MYDVSIIVPIYNMGWCLKEHLSHIVCIKNLQFELILIDDGSTDDSLDICKSFEAQNVRVIHKSNGGISSARNLGLDLASGKYIYFYDPDDVIEVSEFETLKLEQADLLVFGYAAEYYDGSRQKNRLEFIPSCKEYLRGDLPDFFRVTTKIQFPVWNKVFRRDIIEKNHIRFPPIDCWEDACFTLIYLRYVTNIVTVSNMCYHYRIEQRRQSLSKRKFVPNRKEQYIEVYKTNHETLKSLNIQNKEFYTGNNIRLIYNAALDFFYNSTLSKMDKYEYRDYYVKLAKDEYIILALDDNVAISSLHVHEAKIFSKIFKRYMINNNITVLRLYYYIFRAIFAIRKMIT